MKKIIKLFLAFTLLANLAYSQETEKKKIKISKFQIGVTNEQLGFPEGNLGGFIIDDSPTMDNLNVNLLIEDTDRATGFHIGYGITGFNTISWDATFSFAYNKEGRMYTFNFGLGKRLGNEKFHIEPMIRLGLGNGSLDLGDIRNNAEYIQINETQFFDDEVSARLKDLYAYVGPELNLFIRLSDKIGVQLIGGYKFTSNRKSKIEFSGDNGDGDNTKDRRDLSDASNQLNLDGVLLESDQKLLDLQGVYARASLVFTGVFTK